MHRGPIVQNKLFFFHGLHAGFYDDEPGRDLQRGSTRRAQLQQKSRQHYLTNKLDYMPFTKLRLAGSWTWNPTYNRGVLPGRGRHGRPENAWGQQGNYDAGQIFAYSADYLAYEQAGDVVPRRVSLHEPQHELRDSEYDVDLLFRREP
jgi:hypothetical protein